MTDAKHTEYHPFCKVTYWTDEHTAALSDEPWTHCVITALGGWDYARQIVKTVDERDRLLKLLELAFERGQAEALRRVREVLGVPEVRR